LNWVSREAREGAKGLLVESGRGEVEELIVIVNVNVKDA